MTAISYWKRLTIDKSQPCGYTLFPTTPATPLYDAHQAGYFLSTVSSSIEILPKKTHPLTTRCRTVGMGEGLFSRGGEP